MKIIKKALALFLLFESTSNAAGASLRKGSSMNPGKIEEVKEYSPKSGNVKGYEDFEDTGINPMPGDLEYSPKSGDTDSNHMLDDLNMEITNEDYEEEYGKKEEKNVESGDYFDLVEEDEYNEDDKQIADEDYEEEYDNRLSDIELEEQHMEQDFDESWRNSVSALTVDSSETGCTFEFFLAGNHDLYAIKKSGTDSGRTEVHVLSKDSNYESYSLHKATALHETGDNFEFLLADNRDLYAIKKSGTGSGRTEVHVLSKDSNYESFSLHKATALHETGDNFKFLLADNRDLYAIKKSGTGSERTEVHVLSKDSNYESFSLHKATALHETGDNFEFLLADNRDLYAIKKSGTGSGRTEVHVLSKDSNYESFSLHKATALHETGDNFKFLLADNRDLYAIKKSGTGSERTEVHVLSKDSNYESYSLHTATTLHETGDNFEFALADNRDLYAIKKSGTGSGRTEVHVLPKHSNYESFSLHKATALHETCNNY